MERKQHEGDFHEVLKGQLVCYIQTVRSFSRALVLEVPRQRRLEANKLGKPVYSICMLGRTLVMPVVIPSSPGPWNYSRSQRGVKDAGQCQVRRIHMSQYLLPAKQTEGGGRKAEKGLSRQLNSSAITWVAKLRKGQDLDLARGTFWRRVLAVGRAEWLITNTLLLTQKPICGAARQIRSFCTEHEGMNRCKKTSEFLHQKTHSLIQSECCMYFCFTIHAEFCPPCPP